MRITDFFQKKLGAKLKNSRWSWGAINTDTNRLLLRVWKDDISRDRVRIFRVRQKNRKAPGYQERKEHIKALQNGTEGYGVVCTPKYSTSGSRSIADFDSGSLLKFGELIDADNVVYARIVDRVPVVDIAQIPTAHNSVVPDLRSILEQTDVTTREALARARVGQGVFRSQVLKIWGSRCCVTGSRMHDAIRASHIKPWCASTNQERLDPNNGLPLIATLDALFDAGLITFEPGGKLLISERVDAGERNLLGLIACTLARKPSDQTAKYLAYHRQHVFA